jgi:hypothetical protein
MTKPKVARKSKQPKVEQPAKVAEWVSPYPFQDAYENHMDMRRQFGPGYQSSLESGTPVYVGGSGA